jgi:hypothetical protein
VVRKGGECGKGGRGAIDDVESKAGYGDLVAERWSCTDLGTLLGPELMPLRVTHVSKPSTFNVSHTHDNRNT